jgi:hypothetical protein
MNQEGIQTAIYNQLVGIGYPVFDNVPQDTGYPYIVIGDDTSVEWDTDDSIGSESTITIHAWSRYRGRKEVKEMLRAIYSALHRAEFSVEGGYLVECGAEFQETFLESDGLTRHGVIRFRLLVDEGTFSDLYATTEAGTYLQTEAGYYLVMN